MIRPGTNESLSSGQYAAMGNYIIMPQSALSGNPLSSQNQFQRQVQQYQVQQMGQQQILLPQVGGQFPMQGFPFLQSKSGHKISLQNCFVANFFFAIFLQKRSNFVGHYDWLFWGITDYCWFSSSGAPLMAFRANLVLAIWPIGPYWPFGPASPLSLALAFRPGNSGQSVPTIFFLERIRP